LSWLINLATQRLIDWVTCLLIDGRIDWVVLGQYWLTGSYEDWWADSYEYWCAGSYEGWWAGPDQDWLTGWDQYWWTESYKTKRVESYKDWCVADELVSDSAGDGTRRGCADEARDGVLFGRDEDASAMMRMKEESDLRIRRSLDGDDRVDAGTRLVEE
jgi:hypothetical protein